MKKSFDVVIIGAGVVGSAIARELSRYRITTAVLEKEADVSFGTSKANSGIIHAGYHTSLDFLKTRLAIRGNGLFDALSRDLEFPFERRGELMVAFDESELSSLKFFYGQGRKNGVRRLRLLGKKETLETEPNLNPAVIGSLHAPSAGIIGPYEFCFALVENAVKNGVEVFCWEKVSSIVKKDPRSFEIGTEKGSSFFSSFIVNAAGLHADEAAALVGLNDFKILPRKGEEYLLDKRVGTLVKRIIFPIPTAKSKGILIIPTVDGPVMAGPTAEDVESKDDFSTSREGLAAVFEHARKMVPAIRPGDVITAFAGLRPVSNTNDFIIGKTSVAGFINAAGIQSPGLTASPAIALMVRDILAAEGLKLEKKRNFNPKRKAVRRIRELVEKRKYGKLKKIIMKNNGYSKLVCRCENVTEAEIVSAIKKGHTTLDSIKFSCRAESGRCQGSFCTSRIMRIIERETGALLESVTKKGAGSEVLPLKMAKGESEKTA